MVIEPTGVLEAVPPPDVQEQVTGLRAPPSGQGIGILQKLIEVLQAAQAPY
jgi:hypothetical protein